MDPGSYDLTIYEGATFTKRLTWRDANKQAVNLTGWTARLQIRPFWSSPEVLTEMTTGNGRITLGGTAGTITLKLTAAETDALGFERAVYDLELVSPSGDVTRLLQGEVRLSREVTR